MEYAELCAKENNYNAISDLAFYYYKGMGVEKDIRKAHELLVKANELSRSSFGSGLFEDFIKKLEKEMKN